MRKLGSAFTLTAGAEIRKHGRVRLKPTSGRQKRGDQTGKTSSRSPQADRILIAFTGIGRQERITAFSLDAEPNDNETDDA